jgi:hypothetical protein
MMRLELTSFFPAGHWAPSLVGPTLADEPRWQRKRRKTEEAQRGHFRYDASYHRRERGGGWSDNAWMIRSGRASGWRAGVRGEAFSMLNGGWCACITSGTEHSAGWCVCLLCSVRSTAQTTSVLRTDGASTPRPVALF